jgi:3-hydroxyacyl-CoA dehydrogenase/enoyl-CoA hydratase/3-hydroxybutyryl-CoA epimerase
MCTQRSSRSAGLAVKLCDEKHLSRIETRDALDRLMPDPQAQGLAKGAVVIDAAPEDLELKAKIYGEPEDQMKEVATLPPTPPVCNWAI